MGNKEKAKERREKRLQEIRFQMTVPYSDNQRPVRRKTGVELQVQVQMWWSKETVAVVTGGNRGIGFEICRQLAVHGLTVILTSRDSSAGVESIKSLEEGGLCVVYHQLDVVDHSSINQFVEWLRENYGGLDILVNNAGVNFNLGSDNSVENAHKVIETNYYGIKKMIEATLPLMKPSLVGARIVNVSSRLGRLNGRRNRISNVALREELSDVESLTDELIDRTVATFLQQVEDGTWTTSGWPQVYTDYSVSKLAVNAYTRLMARKLSERPEGQKIYINCYCPGWVKTALTGYAGNNTVEEGADTGVWLALLSVQTFMGKFCAERREINF
ncbi:(+)-neomenthol dehydrogenase-like isoform X1 [Vigna umbellata]|uniref:(+)-neomenthol dehydrogenase-like isoform X1 n=1 Tax=Vigna umbellata TaxID=87088 RepID=UPI001F5EB604|nr:(+)-neomenthol dehydrogenase-like isoform X1 [Vigna umbellata]